MRLAQDAKLPAFSARRWTTVNHKQPSSTCRPCRADPLLDVRPMAVSTMLDHSYTWDLLGRWSQISLALTAWRLCETVFTCIAAQLTESTQYQGSPTRHEAPSPFKPNLVGPISFTVVLRISRLYFHSYEPPDALCMTLVLSHKIQSEFCSHGIVTRYFGLETWSSSSFINTLLSCGSIPSMWCTYEAI